MSIVAQGPLVIFCDFADRNSPQDDIQRSLKDVVEISFFYCFFSLFLFCFVLFFGLFWGPFFLCFLSLGFIGVPFRLCYVRSTIFRLYGDVTLLVKTLQDLGLCSAHVCTLSREETPVVSFCSLIRSEGSPQLSRLLRRVQRTYVKI